MELGSVEPIKFDPVVFVIVEARDKSYYCVDAENYANLSVNMSKIKTSVDQMKFVIETYQSYYDR